MKKAKPLEVALMAVLSLAAAYLLNRFWAVLEGLPAGNPIERLLDAVDAIIPSIDNPDYQLVVKDNRITVYPFTHSANG